MPKHIYISKEMLESKLKSRSVRDLAIHWSVSESTIIRLQKKFGLTRGRNNHLTTLKLKIHKIDINRFSNHDDKLNFILGFIHARGKIYNNNLVIQGPKKDAMLLALNLITHEFKCSYPIISLNESYKLVIRDKEFINKLKEIGIIGSKEPTFNNEFFHNGISQSMSLGHSIVNDRNQNIINNLNTKTARQVAEEAEVSISRVRKIVKRYKELNLI